MRATAVRFDPGRQSWVVEFDGRDDRHEHFGDMMRAQQRALSAGLVLPDPVDQAAFSEKDFDDAE